MCIRNILYAFNSAGCKRSAQLAVIRRLALSVRARQTALERQDLFRRYLAHHELESGFYISIFIIVIVTVIVCTAILLAFFSLPCVGYVSSDPRHHIGAQATGWFV